MQKKKTRKMYITNMNVLEANLHHSMSYFRVREIYKIITIATIVLKISADQ